MTNQIEKALEMALNQFCARDKQLLVVNVNERSISHRLAMYLALYFEEWDVDCEYNRDGNDSKILNIKSRDITSDDTEARTVYPDIIVHKRGSDRNLLVVEVKKTSNPEDKNYDLDKLRAFKEQLGYKCAAFVLFDVGDGFSSPKIIWR